MDMVYMYAWIIIPLYDYDTSSLLERKRSFLFDLGGLDNNLRVSGGHS